MDITWPDGEPVTERERGSDLTMRLRHTELSGVAAVRRELRHLLCHWGPPGRADVAELLISELVTNALVHTDRGAVVTATLGEGPAARRRGRLHVEVRDFTHRPPTPRSARESAGEGTSGRGLLLVNALADTWGVRTHGVGKAVWFELDAMAA
ncbi:hypothetical protein ACZ90_01185 [Streptomyces albus subsp. albus]|nr:hypothetical protein ACZ90_01185 [Streptomyces albus subsp. albus]